MYDEDVAAAFYPFDGVMAVMGVGDGRVAIWVFGRRCSDLRRFFGFGAHTLTTALLY